MRKYIIVILLFSIYITCSGQIQTKQVVIRINSGHETIYDRPVTFAFQKSIINLISDTPKDMNNENSSTLNFVAELLNGEFTDEHSFEFDIYINSPSGGSIITEYQVALAFNHDIAFDLSDLTFSYINGSSQFNNKPSHAIGITSGRLTFAVGAPLADTVTVTKKRMGRFRLINNKPFLLPNPLIEWNFDFPINTIIGKNGVDITQQGEFINGSSPLQEMYVK